MNPDAPRVYLAGFDVFRRDAIERGDYLKACCAEHGLTGLYPIDNQIDESLTQHAAAQMICESNIAMIKRSVGVIANLNPFRGHEPDSGTMFEVGMAVALGIPVWAYFKDHRPMVKRVPSTGEGCDADGYLVEDFGFPHNLMIACTWRGASSSPEEAIAQASNVLRAMRQ